MTDDKKGGIKLPPLLGQLLCWLGFHDFPVEKDQCRRCGAIRTRVAK